MEGDIVHPRCVNFITISIHTLRMEGDVSALCVLLVLAISIHTLRMEGDSNTPSAEPFPPPHFNPHPPHGG